MEFRILGPLEVRADGGPIALGGPRQRALLAHLILRANHEVQPEVLIDELWGDDPPETAKATLQTYVYRLRKLLGEDRIDGRDGGYLLRVEPEEIDASRFEAMVKRARASVERDPGAAAAILTDALTLWRGPALGDLADEPSLRGEIARLEELRLSATERRIAAEIGMGGHSTVVSELESLTARHPLRERMWANLMLALYRSGRQAEALSTYQRAREVLADELGADPSPELEELHRRILERDPALGPSPQPAEPTVRSTRVDMPPGTEFAGYRIERVLGRGGMSVVYLAEDVGLERRVALKVLAPQLAEDERFRERFVRESRLAASLDHPNVIPIYGAGESDGELFIAMRYVEGTDLRTMLRDSGPLEAAQAVAIVRQVAAALDAAHGQGLVHRDVKPGNVLLARSRGSKEEHVYLSDFGLTKRSASDSGITGTGQFVGTLDYAAPEQFKGGAPDARTDVYSLGCVIFECLSGHPPFDAENDAGLMYAHLQEQPPSLTSERPELPRAIDGVIAKAMAKDPADRFASAGEMVREATAALRLDAAEAARPPRSRLRRMVPAFAVVAALVAGMGVAAFLIEDTAPGEPDGGGEPAVSPSPAPSPVFRSVERPLTQDEERLLSYIPEDVAETCAPLDRGAAARGELGALVCRGDDVEVLYELFANRDGMNDLFQGNVNRTQAADGECATDPIAVTPYTITGQPAGRVLCYTLEREFSTSATAALPDQSHVEWTDENSLIYAHAVRNDLSDLTLYEWWLTSAGPLVPGDGAAIAKDRPDAANRAQAPQGTFLSLPERGCAGFRSETCAMRIDGDSYELKIEGQTEESGAVQLRKPNDIVFVPERGSHCFTGDLVGPPRTPDPVAYTWAFDGQDLTFERTGGGRCAGPRKLTGDEPWIRAPEGMIAFETGGDIGLMDAGGFISEKLFNLETRPNLFPDWSPDGSRIVFTGSTPGGLDLYAMNADGTGSTPLTDHIGDEYSPMWSPDGSKIAFAFDSGGEAFRSAVVLVNPDGSGWSELQEREGERVERPMWSPDGTRIAFTTFGADVVPHASVMDADGGDLVRLTDEPAAALSWTIDGRRILLSMDGSLVSMRPDGSGERLMVENLPEGGRLVVDRSPHGEWMIMSSLGFGARMYLMRADGGEVFAIGSGAEPSWRGGS